MNFLDKKKSAISLDKRSGRFEFEYGTLPSVATFYPIQLFDLGNMESELMEILFSYNDEMKGASWLEEYIANFSMKAYHVGGGQISLLTFAEPEASPELAYAATVLPNHLSESMKEVSDIYYRPFYILAKMVDKWCIGEVKYAKGNKEDHYYTEYYKMVDKADPIQFIEWVMAREGLSKTKTNVVQSDPVEDFLNSK